MAIELDGLLGITSDGNITTGNFFVGNGYYLTNVQAVSSYNDANVNALLASGSVPLVNVVDVETQALQTIDLTALGNVTALAFIGDGSQLTNLPVSNLGNLTTDIVTTANISGNNLSITSNAVLGNIYSDNFFYANGTPFTSGSSGVIIGDQQIAGDGNVSYALDQAATTQSIIVTLNGVTQIPTTAYTVAGNTITFASSVSNANVIDIRYFAASGGNSSIYGDANVALFMPTYSGNLGTANTTPITAIFTDGYYYANGTPFVGGGGPATLPLANGTSNFDIATANGNPTITSDGNTWTFGGATPEAIYWPDGSFQSTAFVGSATTAEAVSNVGNTTITVDPLGANVVWTFDTAGTLTAPGNIETSGNVVASYLWGDGSNITGLQTITQVPTVYLVAPAAGNNQVFSNVILGSYTANTDMTVFLNGVLIQNTEYTLLGDQLTVNTYLNLNDTIDVTTQFAGNINTVVSGYGNSNVNNYLNAGIFTGDFVPAGNATQSLGNTTNQWKDLWISGNTLYMTQVPISLTSANTLQVDGANVVTSSANGNIDTAGNVNAAGLTVVGTAIITGNANIQGTLTYNDTTNITTSNLILGLGNNQSGINVTGAGIVVGNTAEAQFLYNQPAQTWESNLGIDATGNVTAPYFIGDGSQLTGLPAPYTDSNVTTLLASGTVTSNVITTGNISGDYIIGNGSQLTGLPASYTDSNVTILLSSGNVSSNVITTGNISGNYIIGNGSQLTGLPASYGNANVTTLLSSGTVSSNVVTTGNITGGNLTTAGAVVANNIGNIAAINLNGQASQYLNGAGTWATVGTSSMRDITKISTMNLGATLLIADDRLFCIKSAGAIQTYAAPLGVVGTNTNNLRGLNNCFEITFPNEDVGTLVDADSYGYSSYALFANGNLYTWGVNGGGQLGLGDTTNRTLPVLAFPNVAEVYTHPSSMSVSPEQTRLMVKKTDGTVWACGYNSFGQFGNGTTTNATSFIQLTWIGTNPLSVWPLGSYGSMTVVQKSDGTIWAAGFNNYGQLGNGNTTQQNTAVNVSTNWNGGDATMVIQDIVAGMRYADGGVLEFYNVTMFLDNGTTSRIASAGNNAYGAMGNGLTTTPTVPVVPSSAGGFGGRVRAIRGSGGGGLMTVYVLMTNGDLWSWGWNGGGQVGNNTTVNVLSPFRVMTSVVDVYGDMQGWLNNEASGTSPVVEKADGFYSWGYNAFGMVPNYTTTNALVPVKLPFPKGTAIKHVGTMNALGNGQSRYVVTSEDKIYAYGYNAYYSIDTTGADSFLVPVLYTPNNLVR
jgi:alpha-tubulin suppressor-like RCC1 family protein